MSARQIQITVPAGEGNELAAWLEEQEYSSTVLYSADRENGSDLVLVQLPLEQTQACIERLEQRLGLKEGSGYRLVVLSLEATLPRLEEVESEREERTPQQELYEEIWAGAGLRLDFALMVFLSGLIAAIGLLVDDAATVIGAMVIAPMMGPLLGVSLAAVLGDVKLLGRAGAAAAAGLLLIISVAALTAWLIPGEILAASRQIELRTEPDLFHLLLGLAAGAAGAISMVSPFIASLVGVAVAVALVPPAAVVGIGLAGPEWELVQGAGLLVVVNLLTIIFAGLLVFRFKGARPGRWAERQEAEITTRRAVAVAVVLLLLVTVPLARFSIVAWNENRIRGQAVAAVQSLEPGDWLIRHVEVNAQDDPVRVHLELVVPAAFAQEDYQAIAAALEQRLEREVAVTVVTTEATPWPRASQ